ncbi:MAG: cell division ATPase MinD [ANME-2 cluster archaeon]|nr:cell division ATPase MinD [ANME-2 cluster archaeon]
MTSETCLVLSGKGGVGKTTVFSNIATSLAMMNKETIIIDADLAMPNLGYAFGFTNKPITLHEVLAGKASIDEAIYEGPGGVKVIPGGDTIAGFQDADPVGLIEVIDYLKTKADYIFVDGPVGINEDIVILLSHVDNVIFVVTPDLLSIADALRMKVIAESFDCNIYGVILNRVDAQDADEMKTKLEKTLELKILAMIPYDPNIRISANKMIPIVSCLPNSPAAIAIKIFAANFAGINNKIEGKKVGLFQKLLGRSRVNGSVTDGQN